MVASPKLQFKAKRQKTKRSKKSAHFFMVLFYQKINYFESHFPNQVDYSFVRNDTGKEVVIS